MQGVMPLEVNDRERLALLFSIFHDGDIVNVELNSKQLRFEVEILYLAKRINPEFTKFFVTLENVNNLTFSTWSNIPGRDEILDSVEAIFEPVLEILSAEVKDNFIEVACSQSSNKYAYCGGNLRFIADTATITDESGKSYSVNELDSICSEYWEAWQRGNEA